MSRTQSDQVIDDDENETCPLCIEEFDISDYNFFPCPCGYQVCQFCYNNIKTTMNGLCPACRRQYDDKNIRWKQLTQEEIKSHQETVAQQAKKKAAAKQKEAAKREADTLSRKHLAGIRVRQKNLVYITGMRPTSTSEHLSEILRKDEYFGQYGRIVKIVVSKAKDTTVPNPAVGVYVTFETKEAASKCIQAIDGTQNYDTRLRAQYGTTKYCSAYLRGDTCGKKDCMFLHEPGDENESFSRQDLSSMNVISTQSPTQANMTSGGPSPQPQPPPQQASRPIAAASQAAADDSASQADSADGSGLPPTASWAAKPTPSRKTSQYQSLSVPSPKFSPKPTQLQPTVLADQNKEAPDPRRDNGADVSRSASRSTSAQDNSPTAAPARPMKALSLLNIMSQELASSDGGFSFDEEALDNDEKELLKTLPLLFDPNGAVRRTVAAKEPEQTVREADNQVATQALSAIEADETAAGGSLQLGGEPEETGDPRQRPGAIRPPSLDNVSSPIFGVEQTMSPAPNPAPTTRGMTPAQQQQLLLQSFKSGSPSYLNQGHTAQGSASGPTHARQASRYSFANENSATANVKPVANQKLINQQNSMLPPGAPQSSLSHQQSGSQMFPSGVQGPPPGLKATGTPPVSGGGMFGQGHGFATAGLNYGVNASGRNSNDEMLRDLLRNRGGSAGSGQASDAGRLDISDPSILQARMHQANSSAGQGIYGASGSQGQGGFNSSVFNNNNGYDATHTSTPSGHGSRRSTPALPPGIPLPFGVRLDAFEPLGHGAAAELPLMPELGVLPGAQKPRDPPGLPKKPYASGLKAASPLAKQFTEDQKGSPSGDAPVATDETSFPALPKARPSTASSTETPSPKPTKSKAAAVKPPVKADSVTNEQPPEAETSKPKDFSQDSISSKRQAPGRLDISAANKAAQVAEPSAKSAAPSSRPSSPGTSATRDTPAAAAESPRAGTPSDAASKRTTQPRTLRVLPSPAPKTETPPPVSSTSATSASTLPSGKPAAKPAKQPSRQASIVSAALPDTPASDKQDDSMSATTESVSVSRAGTPPLGNKVGTAPVRAKTKSQAKKERQERAKVEIETTELEPASADSVVHEPIMGRKKKAKKPASAPSAPPPPKKPAPKEQKEIQKETQKEPQKEQSTPTPEVPPTPTPPAEKAATPTTDKEPETPQPDKDVESTERSEAAKRSASHAQSIVDSLLASGDISTAAVNFFKNAPAFPSLRHDYPLPDLIEASSEITPPLSANELSALNAGKPVRRNEDGDPSKRDSLSNLANRLLVTPRSRHAIYSLPRDVEDRLLELEERVHASAPPTKYTHRASTASSTASARLVTELLREMTAGLTPSDTSTSNRPPPSPSPSPAYADDALAYLNQFILPAAPRRPPNLASTTAAPDEPAPISSGIPRTYTTGSPTYSVSGVDVPAAAAPAPPPPAPPIPPGGHASVAELLKALPPLPDAAAAALHSLYAHGPALAAASSSLASVAQAAVAAAAAGPAGSELLGASADAVWAMIEREGLAGGARGGADAEARALRDVEAALVAGRREVEALDRRMLALLRRNRKVAGL